MQRPISFCALALSLFLAAVGGPIPAARADEPAPAKKKVVFIPGPQSHGWSGHAFLADCTILANLVNKSIPGIDAVVLQNGWPKDTKVLEDAAAIVIACDGNGIIGPKKNYELVDRLAKKGVGLAFIHYSLDVGKDNGQFLLEWIGGFYEQFWSVNPEWEAQFKQLPDHPIARGVRPFTIRDEWYYHMRFKEEMKGVTPILSAIPPESTRKGGDGPHSGNPEVRSRTGMAEHVAWAYERPDGGRGFGFTGGHTHWNYANDNYRKVLLNAVCWVAKVDVPADGVASKTPTADDMTANLKGAPPKDMTPEKVQKMIEQVNR